MTLNAWFTIGVVIFIVSGLIHKKRFGPDLIMASGLVILMILRVITFEEATAGFSGRPLLMIAGLFVVAAGLQETGGIELIGKGLLGKPKTLATAQMRMMAPVAVMSAFMSTTPIIAMYLPMINDWAKKLRISPSKLFIPLSFSGILGGQGTMIGTGSNLIIMGLFIGWWDAPPDWVQHLHIGPPSDVVAMWGASWIGIPVAIFGMLFIVLTSKWLLPIREPHESISKGIRSYEIKLSIQKGAAIVGKTIAQADLRNLPGVFLTAIVRDDTLIKGVTPQEVIQQDDKLIFVGDVDSVVDLRRTRGLAPSNEAVNEIDGKTFARKMIEAVVSGSSPLAGQTIRDLQFRTTYNAVILAVHRAGKHIKGKVGNIVLSPGDTLLIEASDDFLVSWRRSSDFYLISEIKNSMPKLHDKAIVSLGILGLLIFLLTTGFVDRVASIWLCGLLMVATRCISGPLAKKAINLQILIVIGAAMGVGNAVQSSGLATNVSSTLLDFANSMNVGDYGTLFLVFIMTSIAAQLMTNYGAAVIMFPIVISAAQGIGVSPYPFVFTMMAAAGCNFLTPISYQTNLMIYGPGGYKFSDFPRIGLPLTLLVAVLATFIAPQVFPFIPTP